MIEHVWTVLCSNVITSRESNNVSLIEVTEQVSLEVGQGDDKQTTDQSIINIPFNLILASLWSRIEDDKPAKVKGRDLFVSPSGKILGELEFNIDLSKNTRMRTMRRCINTPVLVKETGKYRFRTEFFDEKKKIWIEVSNIPLTVNIQVK